jgi:hypothetical protein
MAVSQALTDFQLSCQKYFMCYYFSVSGLEKHAKELAARSPEPDTRMILGTGHPDEKRWHAAMNIGEIMESSQANGVFPDRIAKSFVTAIYSEWDEVVRHRIASECGTSAKAIRSDLMGDLRLIRHCIVHKRSVVTNEHQKLKELKWQLSPGQLTITKGMFSSLIDQINKMLVQTGPSEPKTIT